MVARTAFCQFQQLLFLDYNSQNPHEVGHRKLKSKTVTFPALVSTRQKDGCSQWEVWLLTGVGVETSEVKLDKTTQATSMAQIKLVYLHSTCSSLVTKLKTNK